jgi:hypothetical protein
MFTFIETKQMKQGRPKKYGITYAKEFERQLGTPIYKADYLLKKSLLFFLAGKLNMTNCYRCGKPICLEELSIDHKIDWLHSDNPLENFMNVENITFSHLYCNQSNKNKDNFVKCPSVAAYKRGCRCIDCIEVNRNYNRESQQKYRAEQKLKVNNSFVNCE